MAIRVHIGRKIPLELKEWNGHGCRVRGEGPGEFGK
jgi:hypothetical protein